jgi:2-dehydro-3-deoxyphosphogalactonate aldolase
MPKITRFRTEVERCALIAILRGLRPEESAEIGAAIVEGGISIIEVPLNSPSPLESIAELTRSLGNRAVIGAGTVLDPALVPQIAGAGGELIVSPNVNADVIAASVAGGLVSVPGYFTPSEAFAAANAGAHALKLFPAEAARPEVLKAQKAILPPDLPVFVVGGVRPDTMACWTAAGANGFGLGSSLYQPGDSAETVHARTRDYVAALAHG